MSAISMVFGIRDNVTPAFSKIEKQTIANVREFERLNKQEKELEKTMETLKAAGYEDSEMFKNLDSATDKLTEKMLSLINGTENANSAFHDTSSGANSVGTSMIALNQTLELVQKGWQLVKQATQEAYKMMEFYNRDFNAEFTGALKMHNILGATTNEIQEMFNYASELQRIGIISDEDIKAGMAELAMYTDNIENLRKLTPLMANMAVANKGLYTSSSDVTSAASQLGRALNGQAMMLKREYKLTDEQIKKLNSLATTTEKTAYLFELLNSKVNNANILLADTASGGLIQARNEFNELQEALGEKLMPYITQFEEAFYQIIQPALEWITNNLDTLLPILLGTAAVLGTIVAIMAVMKFAPIILFVGLIALVIYGIDQWMKKQDELTGQTRSTLGLITGMLSTFVAFIYDLIIVPIWNAIASLGNFIANFANDPIASVRLLFVDLATTVLKILSAIAGGIDALFGTNFNSSVNSWISGLEQVNKEIKAASSYEEIMPMLDNWDIQEAAKQGYAFGDNMSKNISKALDENDFLNKLGDAIVPTGNGNALQTTTGDNLLGDEDIQLLFDIATRDMRMEMQEISPQVTITFTGDIHETVDVEDISEAIVTQIEEAVDSDLEVVYA